MRVLRAVMAMGWLLATASGSAAEEIRREHLGLDLLANLEVPEKGKLEGAPVTLIVHGNLAHHGMEIIATLQRNLKARGAVSLAITLSLGRNARRGMLECAGEHEHRASDALEEIGAWVDWLKERGAARITLAGHSRGAQQAAQYAAGEPDPLVDRLVLIAPVVETFQRVAERYRQAYGAELAPLVEAAGRLVEAGEEEKVLELPGFLHCRLAKVAAASLVDYYDPLGERHPVALIARSSRPVLVIGAGSDTVSGDVGAAVQAASLGRRVEIVTIDGADHFFRDIFADDLVEKVAEYATKEVAPR